MPLLLSPLPGHALDLNPRMFERVVMNALPSAPAEEIRRTNSSQVALPSWPLKKPLTPPSAASVVAPPLSILPTSTPSPIGIYPLPQDVSKNLHTQPLPQAPPPPVEPSPFVAYVEPEAEPEPLAAVADFTDHDLSAALEPLAQQAIRRAVHAKESGIDTYLEPMLRSTIRRALAEHSSSSRHFRTPNATSRFFWHLQALFTSRTYGDILFEKTRRFQVEEVFLLDSTSLALISFASCDPARHGSPRRISSTSQRLASQVRNHDGTLCKSFKISDQLQAISCSSPILTLTALVRGEPSELVLADLEFAMNRIEERFRVQFTQSGSPLLHAVQPFLEDCLLIQAPASAA